MDSMTQLEARVRRLETSLRRSRVLTLVLGLAVVLIAGAAIAQRAVTTDGLPAAVTQGAVTTNRLVLRNGSGGVVLSAGPESSLVIENRAGDEVMRIGGRSIRPISE